MAFTPNLFLYHPSNVVLKDYQHAARVFTDDQFRLAPKHKFLYHVAFNINPNAVKTPELLQRHRNEINLLVKAVDLPNYKVSVDTLNQYNRKKNFQTTHKYEPITITFHDDNMGLINQMWQNYYSYYYADSTSAFTSGGYTRNATKNFNYVNSSYGLDNSSTDPFFNYITIYQMARHEYVSYTLINPVINSWNHNKLDSAGNQTHDFTMSVAYEAVGYSSGTVTEGDPEGFGFEHYDQTPSSLQPGVAQVPSTESSTNVISRLSKEIINTVKQQRDTYENTRENQNAGNLPNLATNLGGNPSAVAGLVGLAFMTGVAVGASVTMAKQTSVGKK